ncbi:MAG: hypothetical protein QM627_10860 [Luteolibacter sp.]
MTSARTPNDDEQEPLSERLPEPEPSASSPQPEEADAWDLESPEPVSDPLPDPEKISETPADEENELAEPAEETTPPAPEVEGNPPSAPKRETFSRIEKVGLVALLVLLLGAIAFVAGFSIFRLPAGTELTGDGKFPVKGRNLTIQSAETFWRAPITTGDHPDRVRLGTQLIPVLKMKVEGKNSALRVFFRDAEGNIAGDGINRAITGPGIVEISASVGFNDRGMHAAYRTGEGTPWKIEVYEGPSTAASSPEFRKIYETYVSTHLH